MSYTIEYNKAIYHFKPEGKDPIYFLFIRQGDNNVYDTRTNLRVKEWYYITHGSEKELWKFIGRRAGSVDGGCLQKAVGFETAGYTIEEYIKQYRSKVKNSKPIEVFLEDFSINALIYRREYFTDPKDREVEPVLMAFLEKYPFRSCGRYWYDEGLNGFTSPLIDDKETLLDFLLNLPVAWSKDYKATFQINKRKYPLRRAI